MNEKFNAIKNIKYGKKFSALLKLNMIGLKKRPVVRKLSFLKEIEMKTKLDCDAFPLIFGKGRNPNFVYPEIIIKFPRNYNYKYNPINRTCEDTYPRGTQEVLGNEQMD